MKSYVILLLFIFVQLPGRSQFNYTDSIPLMLQRLAQSKEDTNRISLQLQIGYRYLLKPVKIQIDIQRNLDSGTNLLNQAYQLSMKLREADWQYKALEKLAFSYSRAGDPERCKQYYMRVIAYYHQKGNISKEADTWESLATWYHRSDANYLQETIGNYQRARSLYLQNHQRLSAAHVLSTIAYLRVVHKQLDVAENELKHVMAEYKACGYKKLYPVYKTLYDMEYNKGNYYRALAYCLDAVKSMRVDGDTINSALYYEFAAKCNFAVKNYKESLHWLQRYVAIRKEYLPGQCTMVQTLLVLNRTEEAGVLLNKISKGNFLRFSDDTLNLYRTFAIYYNKINNTDLAVQYYLKTLKMLESRKNVTEESMNSWTVMCNNEIASVYLNSNLAVNAKKHIDKTAATFKNAKTRIDPELLVDFYDNFYTYNVVTGNYANAIKDLEQRVKLQDSLFTADKDKQLAELNIQYETTQKEQAIKNLQSQGVASQAKMEKANLQRNITIFGILVMILISALFYRNYKQKQTTNNIITQKNDQLHHLLTEKEWLLKEVHHRVKNNLHMVISLLESQAAYLKDDALKANEISKHRIYAMSLIHQQLYKTEDIKSIDMSVFLPELLDFLSESYGTGRKILFNRFIEPIKLGLSQAIPIALIVNETVTNSIKYAFPAGRPGTINISMHEASETISLIIADDGIGIDQAIVNAETSSMGLKLMKGLTEDIDGEINIINENGTKVIINFSPDPLDEFSSN